MSNKITWHNTEGKLTNQEINEVEEQLNIRFPKDYLEVVSNNDGGYPNVNVFKLNNGEEMLNNLISFKTSSYSNILETLEAVSDRLPKKVIPFGEDPGGNLICFDYRSSDEPTVVFWDHEIAGAGEFEKAISFVSDSFTDFLNMLHEPIDE